MTACATSCSPPEHLGRTIAAVGTSLTVFLPDGVPEGVRLVYKSHWTGIAVASSRTRYAEARARREEFRTPGVYLLVGPADDPKYESRIYVGESEDPRGRIDTHHTQKDFWNQLVLFTSFGQALNKATIRYLEARLLQLAAEAARAELDNGGKPKEQRPTTASSSTPVRVRDRRRSTRCPRGRPTCVRRSLTLARLCTCLARKPSG